MIRTCEKLCAASYKKNIPGFITVGDLCYGIFPTEHGKILCIRGSKNVKNWFRNVRAMPWRTCGGHIAHKGFVTAYQDLCSWGMPTGKNSDIVAVTGHSLGGAIATLYAEHVGCKLITFGSPKVYFRFSRAPKLEHVRVVRSDDPVQHMPGIFYTHCCEAVVRRDDDWHFLQISDHYMEGYVTSQGGTP